MKKRNITIIIILTILCVICTIKKIEQNDTFYLIKLGEYITHNGIDLLDHFSWIPNLTYTYPHWLYSVFIYLIYHNFGFTGIYISSMLTYITLILSIYFITLKYNEDNFLAFFISFISILVLRVFMVARSHSISAILFLWEVYFINNLIKTGNKKYIFYLTLDSLLIANIHGTAWLMFFVLYLPFLVSQLIYFLVNKRILKLKFNGKIIIEKINYFKLILISFILSLLMGLLTPSRICYTYIIKTMLGTSQKYILEHTPLIIIEAPFIILILFLLYFSKEKVKLHEFFMISGLFLMSFISFRHLIFMYTIGFIYLSIILNRELKAKNDLTFSILSKKIFDNKKVLAIILSICILIFSIVIFDNRKSNYIDESKYPVKAVEYIKKELPYQDIKIYNHYNIGSYLILNDIKVFIDSRCDLYLKEFSNSDIFNDFIEITDNYNYDEIFKKYNIEYLILKNRETLNNIIKNDSNYNNIYQDDYFSIYKTNIGESDEKNT